MTSRDKGIQVIKSSTDERAVISKGGIEIRHIGKPVSSMMTEGGHVYLVVDCSASMMGDKIRQAKSGALDFAKGALSKGYLTGLIRFDSSTKLICEPDKNMSVLEKQLMKLQTGDTTHMAKAISLASNLLKRIPGTRVIVIVTDGMPNGPGDPSTTLRVAEEAKKSGIDIIAIGTDDADQEFLKRLASRKDLGIKVPSKHLQKAITDSASMLPPAGHLGPKS